MKIIAIVLALMAVCWLAYAGNDVTIAPDGSFVSGDSAVMAPDGSFVGSED